MLDRVQASKRTEAAGTSRLTRAGGALGLALATVMAAAPFAHPVAAADMHDATIGELRGSPAVQADRPLTMTSVDRITDNPSIYYDHHVTVVGEIGEVFGDRSFTLEDDDLLFDERMVVVSSRPLMDREGRALDTDTLEGRQVMVTGTVHEFNVDAFEDRLRIDLANARFHDYAGTPAIIATSIVANPVMVGPYAGYPYGANPRTGALPNATYDYGEGVTVDTLVDNPAAYYGRRVTISGEVENALGPRTFTVEDDDLLFDEQIAVVGARPLVDRFGQPYASDDLDDVRVTVTGTVRQLDRAQLERELGIDLDDDRLADWEGRPVIVADSVRQLSKE